MSDFDAIVVGAGCAGSVAALELARAGKSVLMIERGNFAGAKNMTGGRVYAHALRAVFPDNFDEIPFERKVVSERISLMSPDANFTVDFTSDAMRVDGQESYTVLRSTFDQWLAAQAEGAGAEAIYGIAVESLIKDESGAVCGVRAGEDEITADVTVLCDGVNSLLTAQAVGASRPPASQVAVGIKQVLELPASVITDRMLVSSDDEGTAWLFAGDATHGTFGGGFMYANRESISLGIVAGIEATATKATRPVYQMLEDLKRHPAVAPIIRGGKLVEHSGHMVPEGGINIMPKLFGPGVLVAGESAMMCINLGYMVRGIDFAIAAGQVAGQQAAAALEEGDVSEASLARYAAALEGTFVLKDLRRFQRAPAFMEGFTRMFNEYPALARDAMNSLFIVNGAPVEPLKRTMKPLLKNVGYLNLLKDARGAMRAL